MTIMKKILFLLLITCCTGVQAQQIEKFNLSFEQKKETAKLPSGWFKWGDYKLSTDSLSYAGKYAGKITADLGGTGFGSIAYRLPANYEGTKITLEGYMKIKDVENGFAGLLLRIDAKGRSVAFDNMQDQKITGTKDWQKYSISLNYPADAEVIFVGGVLAGKGEAWFDSFGITIDGQNIQTLKEIPKKLSPAQLDSAFDKGSQIDVNQLRACSKEDLALLGRIWGFLKYHHPAIAKGSFNWDYELFRFLPKYTLLKNAEQRDELLISWIQSLGAIEPCQNCATLDTNSFIKPDLDWINLQQAKLRESLLHVYRNRSIAANYYVEMASQVGNPLFSNEASYAHMRDPDAGFRLLALFRYWNIIHYFFPYKGQTDRDWNDILQEYITQLNNADSELNYELALLRLIGEVNDTHANIFEGADKINQWKGGYYPPFQVRFVNDKLIVSDDVKPTLDQKTSLRKGDIIHTIGGKKISDIASEKSIYYPASNKAAQLRNIARDILRSSSDTLLITYSRDDATLETKYIKLYPKDSLDLFSAPKSDEKSFKMLQDNIGYITLKTIQAKDIPVIKETFKHAKGIVIDIRNYPSTFVPFTLGSLFLKTPTPFVKFTRGDLHNPGAFTMGEPLTIPADGEPFNGPIVVLVNEDTQSQAEYTTMAFKASSNCTVIGSTTAGADGNVSVIKLPGGVLTGISGIGVYYPDGRATQRIGIVPDIEVLPTPEGIRQGRDELLDRAIEFILKK